MNVLYETDVFGIAYTEVPSGYSGACAVSFEGRSNNYKEVFPSVEVANQVAGYAIGVHGGFSAVTVSPEPSSEPTFDTFTDWLCA